MLAGPIATPVRREQLPRLALLALGLGTAVAIATLPLWLAALLVLGGLFATIVILRPRWGLYLLPLAVPFGSLREISLGPATVGGTEALVGLFIAAWLARGVARRRLDLHRPPLALPILIWLGVMLLSTLQSRSLAASIKELIKWVETFAVYTIAVNELERRHLVVVVGAMLLAGLLAALDGIRQAILLIGPDGFLFPLAGRLWMRAHGRFIQPNPFAGYLGLVLPLAYGIVAAGLGLGGPTRRSVGARLRERLSEGGLTLLVAGVGGVMALALFLSLSRGGWLGAAAAVVGTSVLLSRRALVLSLLGGALAALLAAGGLTRFVPGAIGGRATDFLPYVRVWDIDVRGIEITNANFSVIERLAHWQAGILMWLDRPWLGQGVGNYAVVYPEFYIPPWTDPLGHAHNIYINMLAETGLVGLLAYLLFWSQALWLALRALRASRGLWRGVAIGLVGAFLHLHVHNFFDNLYVHGMYLHLALLVAVAANLSRDGSLVEEG